MDWCLNIPTNNNLFSGKIKRNATYTTEIRDALRWLIEEGFLERQQGLRDLRRKAMMSASGYPSPTSYHQSG